MVEVKSREWRIVYKIASVLGLESSVPCYSRKFHFGFILGFIIFGFPYRINFFGYMIITVSLDYIQYLIYIIFFRVIDVCNPAEQWYFCSEVWCYLESRCQFTFHPDSPILAGQVFGYIRSTRFSCYIQFLIDTLK